MPTGSVPVPLGTLEGNVESLVRMAGALCRAAKHGEQENRGRSNPWKMNHGIPFSRMSSKVELPEIGLDRALARRVAPYPRGNASD